MPLEVTAERDQSAIPDEAVPPPLVVAAEGDHSRVMAVITAAGTFRR